MTLDMSRYDRWKTRPPEIPEPLPWRHEYLEYSITAFARKRGGDVAGHSCEDCCKFLPTVPYDQTTDDDEEVFEFRCSSCGSRHDVYVPRHHW